MYYQKINKNKRLFYEKENIINNNTLIYSKINKIQYYTPFYINNKKWKSNKIIFKSNNIQILKNNYKINWKKSIEITNRTIKNKKLDNSLNNMNLNKILNIKNKSYKEEFRYKLGKLIGKGSYASVYEFYDESKEKKLAVKIYNKSKMNTSTRIQWIKSETQVLKALNNKYIMKYYYNYETSNHFYWIFELIKGESLYEFSKRFIDKKIPEYIAKQLIFKILKGLNYIHNLNISHRDIKLENIIVDKKWNEIKIIDFGFSIQQNTQDMLKLFCGTLNYMPPEIIQKKLYSGASYDIWSFGVIVYRLVVGYFPFQSKNKKNLKEKILNMVFDIPKELSKNCKSLILKCLRYDPLKRSSAEELLNHEWFK